MKEIRHYVKLFTQGIIVSDYSTKEVETRNPNQFTKEDLGEYVYAFQFFDKSVAEIDGEVLQGNETNYSKTYYINGEVLHKEQLKDDPHMDIAYWNARVNGYNHVVKTKFGQVMIYNEEKDEVLSL